MRYLNFVLTCALLIPLLTSCNKEEATTDEVLIESIEIATEKVDVAVTDLPATLVNEIEENYFESYIESASIVRNKGYEVILGSEDVLYSRLDGSLLGTSMDGRPHRPGPCGIGNRIPLAELPQVIVDYINDNHPNATIKKAKKRGENYLVLLNGHRILAFNLDGDFIEAVHAFRHCRNWGMPVDIANLPDVITTYIADNYLDSEVKVARKMRNGNIVVGILYDGGRKIVIFDENGNFLFDRG